MKCENVGLRQKQYPVTQYGCTFLNWLQRQNKIGKVSSGQIREFGKVVRKVGGPFIQSFQKYLLKCDYVPNTIPSA